MKKGKNTISSVNSQNHRITDSSQINITDSSQVSISSQVEERRKAGRAVPAVAAGGTSNTRMAGCQSART